MNPRYFAPAAATVLALAATLTAFGQNSQERDKQKQDKQKQQDREQQDQRDQRNFVRLSHILDTTVQASDAKNIGKIENLAIDPRTGQVIYAIVDVKNTAEIKNKQNLAIPIRALRFTAEKQARLSNIDMNRLKDAPEFNPSGWNTIGDSQWGRIVHQFYNVEMDIRQPRDSRDEDDRDQNRQQINLVKATDLIKANVTVRQRDNTIGKVEDLLVDVERGFIAFAALEVQKDQADRNRLVAVPWPVFNFDRNDRKLILTVDADKLREAPSIQRDNWNEVDARFTQRVYTHFDVQPDGVYGYVPPRDDDDRNQNQNRERDQNRNNNGDRWGGGGSGGNWHPDSPYGQKFKLDSVQTIRGRVQNIQHFKPMSDMAEGVRLVVQAEGNQEVEVHLGPAWFIERQQMQLRDGEEVRVIGSRVQIDSKPVIMASEIWRGDRVLLLRNRNGLPIWDAWRSADQLSAEESSRDRENRNR